MSNDFEKDNLVITDQVKYTLVSDPKLAEACKDLFASMSQAHRDWKSGKYASFDDAMFAITGKRPELVTDEEAEELGLADIIEQSK